MFSYPLNVHKVLKLLLYYYLIGFVTGKFSCHTNQSSLNLKNYDKL